jgi:hypothetical protein
MQFLNTIHRKVTQLWLLLRYLPIRWAPKQLDQLVIVSASDESHFLSLAQFIRSVYRFERDSKLIVYDLGIAPVHRRALESEFPDLEVRRFRYEDYPDFLNIAVNAGQYAWKPVIIAEVVEQLNLPTVWMDAGNVILERLTLLRRILRQVGFYSPHSQGTMLRWCHPAVLNRLQVDPSLHSKQNLNGACIALNPEFPESKILIARWRELALVREYIAPKGSNRMNHRQDQALLTVLAYQAGLAQRVYPGCAGFAIHRDIEAAAPTISTPPDQCLEVMSPEGR